MRYEALLHVEGRGQNAFWQLSIRPPVGGRDEIRKPRFQGIPTPPMSSYLGPHNSELTEEERRAFTAVINHVNVFCWEE